MTIKEKKCKFIPALFLILLVTGTAVLLFLSNLLPHANNRFEAGPVTTLDTRWTITKEDLTDSDITLPTSLPATRAALTNTLPDALPEDAVLGIPTAFQSLTVTIDGTEVYNLPADSAFGSLAHVVSIPKGSGGKTVTLTFESVYPTASMSVGNISLGSRAAVLFAQLDQDTGSLLVSLIILIIGILLLVVSGFLAGPKTGRYRFVCLGTFSVLAALWILTDSNFLQFLPFNSTLGVLLSFYSFTLMSVPILQFIKLSSHKRYHKAYDIITLLMMANFLLNLCVSTVSVLYLPKLLIITHALLISAILLFLWCLVHSWVKCHEKRFNTLFAAFFLLCVAGIIDLVRFYDNPVDNDNSFFFKIGLLVFIAILGLSSIKDSLNLFRDAVHVEIYKKLAYTDSTTQLANRTAYERDLESTRNALPIESLTIVSFDLNNLKLTNDTLGHSVGDTLIIDSGGCICASFKDCGACYRIGGDEFCVIAENLDAAVLENCLEAFDVSISDYNRAHSPKLDIARGYSRGPVRTPEDLDELIRRADQAMYACKARSHSQIVDVSS